MDSTVITIVIFLFYLALLLLYIYLLILFIRMTSDVNKIKETMQEMSYRDTARYISEVNKGTISREAQEEADKKFSK